METPSSARRITRSQALAAANSNNIPMSKKIDESEKGVSKSRSRNGKPQALIDITNDSPIVGLAMGSLGTPLSTMSKKKNNVEATPGSGSGEALLRGQVKTLLQKVEEEAELSKIPIDFVCLKGGLTNSPMALLAPTPANTPHLSNLSCNQSANKMDLDSVESSPILEQFNFSQMVMGKKQDSAETEKDLITRSLLSDFSEKSEGSSVSSSDCISVVTYQGISENNTTKFAGKHTRFADDDDDSSSIWSIQVNTSAIDDEEDEEEYEEEDEEEYEEENEEEYEEYDEGLLDDLCEGISKISVNNGEKITDKFAGKHTRFVYDSDGEIEEEAESPARVTEGILRLKGLPTPKGKHVRFAEVE